VPETAVHENREFELRENEIRFAKKFLIAPPTCDAMRSQKYCQSQFRVLVPAPANPRHHFRPLRLGENVRHLFLTTDEHGWTQIHWPQQNTENAKEFSLSASFGESPTPPSPIGWERGWG